MSGKKTDIDDSRTVARQLLASALEMEIQEIPDDAAIGFVEKWDSLAHMRLIMALEEHKGESLAPDVVVAIGTLNDIESIVKGEITGQ